MLSEKYRHSCLYFCFMEWPSCGKWSCMPGVRRMMSMTEAGVCRGSSAVFCSWGQPFKTFIYLSFISDAHLLHCYHLLCIGILIFLVPFHSCLTLLRPSCFTLMASWLIFFLYSLPGLVISARCLPQNIQFCHVSAWQLWWATGQLL